MCGCVCSLCFSCAFRVVYMQFCFCMSCVCMCLLVFMYVSVCVCVCLCKCLVRVCINSTPKKVYQNPIKSARTTRIIHTHTSPTKITLNIQQNTQSSKQVNKPKERYHKNTIPPPSPSPDPPTPPPTPFYYPISYLKYAT